RIGVYDPVDGFFIPSLQKVAVYISARLAPGGFFMGLSGGVYLHLAVPVLSIFRIYCAFHLEALRRHILQELVCFMNYLDRDLIAILIRHPGQKNPEVRYSLRSASGPQFFQWQEIHPQLPIESKKETLHNMAHKLKKIFCREL